MVKVSDCTCCDCDSAQEKEQIKERALSSINKIYTFDNRTFWPDGTGMVTIPLPTQEQLNKLDDVVTLTDQVAKNTKDIGTNAELIAGEQTQIDSLKTTLETSYQAIVQKGSANGYAGLDNNARVPLAQLYAGTSANQIPLIGKQLLANEMLVVDADGLTVRSKPIVQTLSFRGIYPAKSALPSEGNVSGDYAIVSDGTAQADTGYYVWGYNTGTSEYEWVWTILFDANSYQLISNLVTVIDASSDDSHYPSAKAVKDYHDASIGTVEQEITDINNDLATVQTTLNEHTTGIANAITQAQDAYKDAAIADSVMTLTKGNGETTQIEIPGGDEWEELTASNWPNDFTVNDTIKVLLHPILTSTSNYPYWASAIPIPKSAAVVSDSYNEFTFTLPLTKSIHAIPIEITLTEERYGCIYTIHYIYPISAWNEGSTLFEINSNFFNAVGCSILTKQMTINEIGSWMKIYRKK